MKIKLKDRIGQVFTNLTVTDVFYKTVKDRKMAYCKCRCKCGKEINVLKDHLLSGHTKSCGCIKQEKNIDEILNKKQIGELKIISFERTSEQGNVFKCIDKYKNIRYTKAKNLRQYKYQNIQNNHGLTGTRLYCIHVNMVARCYNNKSMQHKNYGGRGVTICEGWLSNFKVFYDWAMANGYKDNLTIDRINNDGNYEPSNCRWITNKEQQNNRSNNNIIEIKGKKKNLAQWCKELNLKRRTIYRRVEYGMTFYEALTIPLKR